MTSKWVNTIRSATSPRSIPSTKSPAPPSPAATRNGCWGFEPLPATPGCDRVSRMTKLFEEAIKKVRELPESDQDEAAEMLLSLAARNGEPVRLDDETRAAIREGRAQARRGDFATDEERAPFFTKQGTPKDATPFLPTPLPTTPTHI